MSNEAEISGSYNQIVQGAENSTINLTQIFANSYQYQELTGKLKDKQELFDLTPETNTERRLQFSAEINQIKETFEQFKRDVLALAETFNKIEINTDRLRRAKEFFDKGEIGEARAVLEMELEQMQNEQTHLLKEKEHFEKDILPNLINNSEEFYILAMATQTDYDNPNRFEDICKYFEDSIKSYEDKNNILQYARFLQLHFNLQKAEKYYKNYLEQYFHLISSEERAIVLNNLGALHQNQNEFDNAIKNYEESLAQFQQISDHSDITLQLSASVIRNLAILHRDYPKNISEWKANNSNIISLKLFNESIGIYEALAKDNAEKYLPNLATTYNSLAKLYEKNDDYSEALIVCEKSLKIRSNLANQNEKTYLKDMASSLKRLADLHSVFDEYQNIALSEYEKVLKIRKQLAKDNPKAYLHQLASTYYSKGKLYERMKLIDIALKEYKNALRIYNKISQESPKTFLPTIKSLKDWISIYHYEKKSQCNSKYINKEKMLYDLSNTNFITYYEIDFNSSDYGDIEFSQEML